MGRVLQDQSVYIDTVNRNAQGYLGSVRNSTNPSEALFCSSSGNSLGKNGYGYAYDGRTTLACNTADPTMIGIIHSVAGDGGVYFAADANGQCTFVWAFNASYMPPKKP
jgi:arginine/ornithine N-succinyltransferase beta subunit